MSFLLVHSPVVGPVTWRWVGDALQGAGETVIVPDLVEAATSGDPLRFVSRAASTVSTDEEWSSSGTAERDVDCFRSSPTGSRHDRD